MRFILREILRILERCRNTYDGIVVTMRDEPSYTQWMILNTISIIATFFVEMTTAEQIIIIALGQMVLVVELLNTGIESTVDRIGAEIHPLSKKAKDVACAATTMTAATAVIAWLLVLFT
jgi:diacylglycerol kinase (ATP)